LSPAEKGNAISVLVTLDKYPIMNIDIKRYEDSTKPEAGGHNINVKTINISNKCK